jgi:hypothetical protein
MFSQKNEGLEKAWKSVDMLSFEICKSRMGRNSHRDLIFQKSIAGL